MKKAQSNYKPRGYAEKNAPPVFKSSTPGDLKFRKM